LIKEGKEQSKATNGKKKSPFVKKALPGEEQTYDSNPFFLGLCQFSAIFFLNLHIFIYGVVYDTWGQGSIPMIIISSVQILVGIYVFLFAYLSDIGILSFLYAIRFIVLILGGVVLVPVFIVTLMAFFAYMQADQIASYIVS